MKIKPTYITWEQAKLAHSKGLLREDFGVGYSSITRPYYNEKGEFNGDCTEHIKRLIEKQETFLYAAPEQWQLVEWLRLNHGIWITLDIDINGVYRLTIRKYNSVDRAWEVKHPTTISERYNSPQEAYSEAFDYILKELI